MTRIYVLRREWTATEYQMLIAVAQRQCTYFLLVHRDSGAGIRTDVVRELAAFLVDRRHAACWPGTELLGSAIAEVDKFWLTTESVSILQSCVRSLWSWQSPNPEDLSFLRRNGTVFFASIVHEKDAFFKLTDKEKVAVENVFGEKSLEMQYDDPSPDERY